MKALIVLGVLISSTLQWILGGAAPQPQMICHYSDGLTEIIPGYNCPLTD